MFIECAKMKGRSPYLRVSETYSVSENGVTKTKKRILKNIGPLPKFDDGKPDYMARLKKSFKDGEPLIAELAGLSAQNPTKDIITITFDRRDKRACMASPKNIGGFLLDGLYNTLGIYEVLCSYKSRNHLEYDLNGNTKLLTFGRVLFPDSKLGTFEDKDRYLFGLTKSDKVQDVYDTLDALHKESEAIQTRMNLKISQTVGRNTEVCFYDVTNYYFEIGENDPDQTDKDGTVTQGLRKKGVSKENRREPIVQMGLFIDDNGIPIAYRLFPGNHTDQTTLRPALEKSIDKMNFGRVIIVADGGLNNGANIAHILEKGNGYIISKSTKKSDKTVKSWILDESGYVWNDKKTFKMKSQIRTRKIKKSDGTLEEITEKLICYWSKKHYDRERHENEKFIEYLDSVIANPDKLKDKPKKIEKFLKKTVIDKKTGEVISAAASLSIDMDKVREYIDLMGYYTIMSSELDKTDDEIINKYHGLSRIEDSFRITKSDLEGRPVFVRTPEHINAHFLTCFIALTMIRLIQYKILKFQGKDTKNIKGWTSGLSAERIQKALTGWQADALPGNYYRLTQADDDLLLILGAFGINADLLLPNLSQMRQLRFSCKAIDVV
jgi:transposase